jgi:ATP-dependent Clp protease ATP-binding subunit ClpA
MFERLSAEARQVLAAAQDDAVQFGSEEVGPQHLLLAVVEADAGIGRDALDGVVDVAALRKLVILGDRQQQAEASGALVIDVVPADVAVAAPAWAPAAKAALEGACRQSLQLRDPQVGSEHLLLALLDDASAVGLMAAAQEDLSVDVVLVARRRVIELREQAAERARWKVPEPPDRRWQYTRARAVDLDGAEVDEGFEPFAVSVDGAGSTWVHLRRPPG